MAPFRWDGLIQLIHEDQMVIPVVGRELSKIKHLRLGGHAANASDWEWVHIDQVLIDELMKDENIAREAVGAENVTNLTEFLGHLCTRIKPHAMAQMLYAVHEKLMGELRADPSRICDELRSLAAIRDFPFWVTTATDDLLTIALEGAGRSVQRLMTQSDSISPDLPDEEGLKGTTHVYHLFGKIRATATFAMTEEKTVEYVSRLFHPDRPRRLFLKLSSHNLLLLGNGFPDWLARFFLRLLKIERTASTSTMDTMAELCEEPLLVRFLERFSQNTTVYREGDVFAFIRELSKRLEAQLKREQAARVAHQGSVVRIPPMLDGAVFISYTAEDKAVAEQLAQDLEERKIDYWLDTSRVGPGSQFEIDIERNIRKCDAFVPIISVHTEARREGFFRREWSWAIERKLYMSDDRCFFFPLVVDVPNARRSERVPSAIRKFSFVDMLDKRAPEDFFLRLKDELRGMRG